MSQTIFEKESVLAASAEEAFAWHARPGAIERLSPPWDPLTVIRRSGGIQPGAEVVMRLAAGPFFCTWHARHTDYEENRLFRDEQLRGPFARWTHTHFFEPLGPDQCRLRDTIRFVAPLAGLTGPLADPIIRRRLVRIFAFRHRLTAADLVQHRQFRDYPRQTVLISGAGGLIGSRLVPFLTTGGHRVVRLVRWQPQTDEEIFWDPAAGRIDSAKLATAQPDAVIHLAGENVGQGRWTPARKKEIIDSREKGTTLVAAALAGMKRPPRTFLSASAIGFYGDRGEEWLTEKSAPGGGFLARVCRQWEDAVRPAVAAGIRTVRMRIGVVLTPEGGALKELLPLFRLGLGGRIGSGRQYISWIGMDDAVGAIYTLLMRENVFGPVNIVAPHPATNAEFARALAGVLGRPAVLPVPATLIRAVFGEMGKETVLFGARARPDRLAKQAYPFQYPQLPDCLAHQLGRMV
ncbi:MAG: TIGR01777 family oxidoreductase [Desulfosudaceae bacterium]